MKIRFFGFIIMWSISMFLGKGVLSQCSFPANMPIVDYATTTYSLTISGAIDNSLTTNGVCGVSMKFRHTLIGDISIKLVSPSGQQVTLIGPTAPNSTNSSFTVWDINFVPNSAVASPDFGFSPRFNNLLPWGQLFTYSGTYYPNVGNLENFNSGPVNGTWSIIVNDVNQLDQGVIESFSLVFCDDRGITCSGCNPRAGSFVINNIIACLGSPELAQVPPLQFLNSNPDTANYASTYYLFNTGDTIIYRGNSPSMSNLPFGKYNLCHTNFRKDFANNMPVVGGRINDMFFQDSLDLRGICGDVSDTCLTIEVLQPLDTFHINREICAGDTAVIFGLKYFSTGNYPYSKPGSTLCDSLFIINIDVIDLATNISPALPQLICQSDTISLVGSVARPDKPVTYNWSTLDGRIIGNPSLPTVEVDRIGTYRVAATYGNCLVEDSVVVSQANNTPTITLIADSITCSIREATLRFSSGNAVSGITWMGPGIVATGALTAKVDQAGIYGITAISNGCVVTDTVLVGTDTLGPTISFDVDPLDCIQRTGIITWSADGPLNGYNWVNPSDFRPSDSTVISGIPDVYILNAIADNGCNSLANVSLVDDFVSINLSVLSQSLDCSVDTINPSFIALDTTGSITFMWFEGSTLISVDQKPQLTTSGQYRLEVTDEAGCIGSDTFSINLDRSPPVVTFKDTIFTCLDDSIQIGVLTGDPSYRYRWNGPFAFYSDEPTPFIYDHGTYTFEVIAINNCTETYNITVAPDPNIPTLTFDVIPITCGSPVGSISAKDTFGINLSWTGPGTIVGNNTGEISVTEGGEYTVRLERRSDNCKNAYLVTIPDERDQVFGVFSIDDLRCSNPTVKPDTSYTGLPAKVTWTNEDGITVLDGLQPTISKPGKYYISILSNAGCMTMDSIEVVFDGKLPSIDISGAVIECERDSSILTVTSDIGTGFVWEKNGSIVGSGNPFVVYDTDPYKVIVTASNGCIDSSIFVASIDTIPQLIDLTTSNGVTCDDSIATIIVAPFDATYDYTWTAANIISNRVSEIDVNAAGIVTVEVKDDRGCISKDTIDIKDTRVIPFFELASVDINCRRSGKITIENQVNVASTNWSGPQSIPNNTTSTDILIPGVYTVTALSSIGCTSDRVITVSADTSAPVIATTFFDTLDCANLSINIGANIISSFDTVAWTGPIAISSINDTIQVNKAGNYNARVIGSNGCITSRNILVTQDTMKPVVAINIDTITCLKTKVLIKLDDYDDIASVRWIGQGLDVNSLSLVTKLSGVYIAEITGNNGCVGNGATSVYEDVSLPVLDLQDTFYLPCNGDSIQLSVGSSNPIDLYRWIGQNFFSLESEPRVLDLGKVLLFAAGENGCNAIDSTVMIKDTRPIDFDVFFDSINCYDPLATLMAIRVDDDESFKFLRPDGSTAATTPAFTDQPGQHSLIVHRSNQCYDTIRFVVKMDTISPKGVIIYNDKLSCDVTEVNLLANIASGQGNLDLLWGSTNGQIIGNQRSDTLRISSGGTYTLRILNTVNGCTTNLQRTIFEEPNSFKGLVIDVQDPICNGDTNGFINILQSIGGFGNVNYLVNGDEYSGTISNLGTGVFNIVATDELGCTLDTTVLLVEGLSYGLNIIADTILALGDKTDIWVEANQGVMLVSNNWINSLGDSCQNCWPWTVMPTQTGVYTVTTTSNEGCITSDSIAIKVRSDVVIPIANVFNPISTEGNELFKLPSAIQIDHVNFIRIYDRWGSLMHNEENLSPDMQRGWNGTYDGRVALPGVYVVMYDVTLTNGNHLNKVTHLTLIR